MVDAELANKIKTLSLQFKEKPQPELLIRIPNTIDSPFTVENVFPEFTSLCPLNISQPDFATITLRYIPKSFLVELKSLKLYLTSYRQCPIFHEQVVPSILNDLVKLLGPVEMLVAGNFTVRGGISTSVSSYYKELEVTVKRSGQSTK